MVSLVTRSFLPRLKLKRLEQILRRLRVLILLDLRSSPTVLSTLLLFAPSKPGLAHQKHTRGLFTKYSQSSMLLVDQAGVEPASGTLFSSFHTAITYSNTKRPTTTTRPTPITHFKVSSILQLLLRVYSSFSRSLIRTRV